MRVQHKPNQWIWVFLPMFGSISLFFSTVGVIALFCMLAPVVTAFYKGRKWCGAFCPRGNFNDVILPKVSFHKEIPALLRQTWFRILFLVLLMSAFTMQLIWVWGDLAHVGLVFARMVIITTLLAIILGIIYKPRTWCMICPMGTMASFVTKATHVKRKHPLVNFTKEKCVDCRICSKSCVIGIDVHQYKDEGQVLDTDCLKCNVCVGKCPKKALKIV